MKVVAFAFVFVVSLLTRQVNGYTTAWWHTVETTPPSTPCPTPACEQCPAGYNVYIEHLGGCSIRCLCQRDHNQVLTSPRPSLSKNLLLSILGNIQKNAAALEQMASGLSDEADLAREAAVLS